MIDRLSRRRGESGFTLIELLVVIIILGILAAVVVFAVRGSGDKGKAAAYATDAKTVRTAQEAFCAKYGQYGTERQLAGLDPGPDGQTTKFLSEVSDYHATAPKAGGPCTGAGNAAASAFSLECNVAEEGCGEGGATPTGGTLLLPLGTADFTTLNSLGMNPAITSQGTVHTASELFFNGLLAWGPGNSLEPDLATDLGTILTGPGLPAGVAMQATFNLKPGVKFHSTSYFTPTRDLEAQDVQFTFDKGLLPFHSRTSASMRPALCNGTSPGLGGAECAGVAGIETPSSLQVVFNFKYVYGPLRNQLNVTEAPIISKEWYQACNFTSGVNCSPALTPNPNLNPIGTGPFKLSAYNSPTSIEAVKHPDYFNGPTLPYFDKVVQTVTPNTATAVTSGAIDTTTLNGSQQQQAGVIAAVNNGTIQLVRGIPRGSGGGNCITTLGFNLWTNGHTPAMINGGTASANPILGEASPGYTGPVGLDPNGPGTKVRRAVAHALNRQTFFTQIQFSEGEVSKYPIDSRITFAHPKPADLTPQFDVTAANQLLDEAGWGTEPRTTVSGVPNIRVKNGVPLSLHFVTPAVAATPSQFEYGSIAKDQLDDVGIFVQHQSTGLTGGSQPTQVFVHRQFDISIASYCNGDDPEVGVRRQLDMNNVSTTTFSNMAGIKDPAINALLDTAVQGATLGARGATYQQLQESLVGTMPYVWMVQSETTRAVRSNCTGFNFMDTGLFAEPGSCHR